MNEQSILDRIKTLEVAVNLITEKLTELAVAENAYINIIQEAKNILDEVEQVEKRSKFMLQDYDCIYDTINRNLNLRLNDLDKYIKNTLVDMALKNGITVTIATPDVWLNDDD